MSWFELDGSRIYYEQTGQGAPLLFLPGITESIGEFQAVRQTLAGQFTVIAADLPGSGKSEPQPRDYKATYYEDDAVSFLALLDHLHVTPASIVGFSDGGEVALVMAGRRPEAISAVVVWGTAGSIEVSDELIDAFNDIIDNPGEGFEGFSDHLKAVYGEDTARRTIQSAASAWRAIKGAGGDISRDRAGQISAPVLLITGEHDPFAPPPVVSDLAGAIPGAEYIEVKDAEHAVHESHEAWFLETVTGWLRKN